MSSPVPLSLRRPRLLLGLLIAALAILYLAGNARVGFWDRDEPRYAQTSRQMLHSNPPDWVVPRLLDEVRTAKPIFIYWCQAISMRFFGVNEFAARFPSVLAMLLTLIVLGIAVGRFIGWRRALWTVFMLGTCGLAIGAAKMAITDSVLLLWITLGQLCLYAIYAGEDRWSVIISFWLCFGLAILTKGPVVLAVQGSTLLVLFLLDLERNRPGMAWRKALGWWRRLRPGIGLLIVALVVGPWIWQLSRRAPGFLSTTLAHDVWTRSIRPLEGHRGPPGFYLLTAFGTYLPWSLFLPGAVLLGFRNRRLAPIRFAMAAMIGPWFVMEMVQTKLVHYVLPAFPPLAFLTADGLIRCFRGQFNGLRKPAFLVGAAVWSIAIVGFALSPWLATRHFSIAGPLLTWTIAITVIGIVYSAVVFMLFLKRRYIPATLAMGIGMWISIFIFYTGYLPDAEFLWLPERVGASLRELGATRPGDVVMIDYREDSLPYYQGGTIRPRHEDFLRREPVSRWPTWIVLTRQLYRKLPAERAARLEIQRTFRGLAYADRGRVLEVIIARKK